jgi:hypothetical protein
MMVPKPHQPPIKSTDRRPSPNKNLPLRIANEFHKQRGIEFTTAVPPDPYHPAFVFWSGEREGVRNEDGYAKISVSITFCNQLEQG